MHCFVSVFICIALSSTYVGSLYIWYNTGLGRNHPSTIKRRFISISFMTIISAIVVYCCIDDIYFKGYDYWIIIGIRHEKVIEAIIFPLLLTMILFSGPLVLHYLEGMYQKSFCIRYWMYTLQDLTWLRNHVVAPFSEEFTFRACMLPILVPCFGKMSMFICPLFFGIAHLHHLKEKLYKGTKLKVAILSSLFEMGYTTIFGAYSSYLFLRTGHIVSPLIAHAFCNYMGFPDFEEVLNSDRSRKIVLSIIFTCGLLFWMMLLVPMTEPKFYKNELYSLM